MSPVVIVGEEFSALSFSHLFSSPLDLQLSPKSSAASFAPALTGGVLVWMVVQHQPVVVWPAHGYLEANACDIDGFGLCGHSMSGEGFQPGIAEIIQSCDGIRYTGNLIISLIQKNTYYLSV
jgi:hypothetical protein